MLSSWLYRLAAANRLSMAGLTEMNVQRRLGWLRDIDRFAPVELVENLAATVGKEFVECGAGTFMEWDIYLDNLTEKSRSGGSARWYLKAPRPVGARVNPIPIQYCPECLRDPDPYFRKSWRMSFVTLCPSHDAQLQSTCHSCGTPFFYAATMHAQKVPAADVGLRHCLQCNADLSQSAPIRAPGSQLLRQMQAGLVDGLADGTATFPWMQTRTVKVLGFVEHLPRLLGQTRLGDELQRLSSISVDRPVKRLGGKLFDAADAVARAKLLQAAAWLLEDWPSRYETLRRAGGTPPRAAKRIVDGFNFP